MNSAYADTSFLISLLGNDSHTASAHEWMRVSGIPILITSLSHFEYGNALRLAVFRKVIEPRDVKRAADALESDIKTGHLRLVASDLSAVTAEATRLSELLTPTRGYRSFDILHVATATVLKVTTFLTFDANQRKLAAAAGLEFGS